MPAVSPDIVYIFPVANSLIHITGLTCQGGLCHMQNRFESNPLCNSPLKGRNDFQGLSINNLGIGIHRLTSLPIPFLGNTLLKESHWLIETHPIEESIAYLPLASLFNSE